MGSLEVIMIISINMKLLYLLHIKDTIWTYKHRSRANWYRRRCVIRLKSLNPFRASRLGCIRLAARGNSKFFKIKVQKFYNMFTKVFLLYKSFKNLQILQKNQRKILNIQDVDNNICRRQSRS